MIQFCAFSLGDVLFGIETRAITGIVCRFAFTPVPRSRSSIAGIMNHRGHIVTLVRLAAALELPPTPAPAGGTVIFVKEQNQLTGLLVDGIGDVVTVEPARGQAPPVSMGAQLRNSVSAIHQVQDRLLLALDLPRLFRLPTLIAPEPETYPNPNKEALHDLVS